MDSKSFRIQTLAGGNDKYLKIKLEQEVNLVEVLSLQINQKDLYASFNGDFGVLIGRIIANGGVGVPNAKVSIFIPISEDDKLNSDVLSVYPYSTPRDKNLDGVRYNLLPRVATNNPFLIAGEYLPVVPIGTFPTKEEITTNQTYIEVFEKYYKFTTISNNSGDYMIYGAPIGNQIVHMSVDITDIGKYSMTPATMITNLGYSPNLFTDSGTRVKYSTDLDVLPNVETQEIAVDIKSFWGDDVNFSIGITRQDFKIRATLISSFTIFGAAFTDSFTGVWGRGGSTIKQLYAMNDSSPGESANLSISTKRNGLMNEKLFYIPNTVSDSVINANTFNPKTDYKIMDQTQYGRYVNNGTFIYIIPCNRTKIITNEDGTESIVSNDDPRGIFTTFNGFMLLDYSDKIALPIAGAGTVSEYNGRVPNTDRMRFKIPQNAAAGISPPYQEADSNSITYNDTWRRQHKKFTGGEFYSVARFQGVANDISDTEGNAPPYINTHTTSYSSGAIVTNYVAGNASCQFPNNGLDIANASYTLFAAEYMNFSIYFPQYTRYSSLDIGEAGRSKLLNYNNRGAYESNPNNQLIAATEKNTMHMGRADLNATYFIHVPKEDILNIINQTELGLSPQGFTNTQAPYTSTPLIGTEYKSTGGIKYFYKGLSSNDSNVVITNGNADVFLVMRSLGII
jgi:hypothetical protein